MESAKKHSNGTGNRPMLSIEGQSYMRKDLR
jgi:hypothetical protein